MDCFNSVDCKGDEKIMYSNLKTVVTLKKVTHKMMSDLLGIGTKSVYNKLNGASDWTIPEAMKLKTYLFPEYDLNWLFATDTKTA